MESYPLISVALCSYNGAKFLKQQLDSILEQTYPNLEILIVDDCSVDSTVSILRDYESKYDNIKVYINKSNKGVNRNFSKAIELCRGEFIAISDQDDIWFPNKIEEAYKRMQNDVLMVYSNSLLIDEDGNSINRLMFGNNTLYSGDDPRSLSLLNNIAGHTMMFKAELKDDILPIPRHCHYDWWIGFVAVNAGYIECLDSPFVMHRVHSTSASEQVNLIEQDRIYALQRWSNTMLSVKNLKHRSFFEELHTILNSNAKKKIQGMKLFLFQIKYSRFIFPNKGLLSRFNRARKLNFPHIPD